MIAVISFNILTREYYKDDKVDNKFRKRFILFLIKKWTSSRIRPLIALQEVTGEWKDDIEEILLKNGYNSFSMNYGYRGNGYLGVLSAIPKEYSVLKVNYINIGDELLEEELFVNNFVIELILKDINEFIFYNYHLPVPKKESINQIIHAVTLKKRLSKMRRQNKMRRYGIIWAGDFNIKPYSEIYNLILKSENDLELESSYKSYHGIEPKMTTHTKDFKDTLDYIFITNDFKCINSKVLQYNEEIMPNKYNPSDHMPLISILYHRK